MRPNKRKLRKWIKEKELRWRRLCAQNVWHVCVMCCTNQTARAGKTRYDKMREDKIRYDELRWDKIK